jgi:hypothetical protein
MSVKVILLRSVMITHIWTCICPQYISLLKLWVQYLPYVIKLLVTCDRSVVFSRFSVTSSIKLTSVILLKYTWMLCYKTKKIFLRNVHLWLKIRMEKVKDILFTSAAIKALYFSIIIWLYIYIYSSPTDAWHFFSGKTM